MKKENKEVIFVIILILVIVSILIWKYFDHSNNISILKFCCNNNYNGIFEYNDCINEKCFYGTQLGWGCHFMNGSTQVYLPAKLMYCK